MAEGGKKVEPEDPRIDFLERYVSKTLRVRQDKWMRMVAAEENKEIIMSFFTNPNIERLVFSTNAAGATLPYHEYQSNAKGNSAWFCKTKQETITIENIRTNLSFGGISERPINDLQILVDDVFVPMLTNPNNQEGWPQTVKTNVERHLQTLKNSIAEVLGNISNRTKLPLPITINKVMELAPEIEAGNIEACPMYIKNSLEEMIIKWSRTVADIINEDLFIVWKVKKHPTPEDEFKFWDSRMENLENIYNQLCDPRIKTIAMILERIDSVYFNAFSNIFKNIDESFYEAEEIAMYLTPLRTYVEKFRSTDFSEMKDLIDPIMAVMCLTWGRSRVYCSSERMSHMFRLLHNMMIEEAKTNLDPGSLFQGEVDEGLKNISLTISLFQYYKDTHAWFRSHLPEYIVAGEYEPPLWSFKPEVVFEDLNNFLKRLYDVKDLFLMCNEFVKLERVEIGGLKGGYISRNIQKIYEQYKGLYTTWINVSNKYDLLDSNPKLPHFEREKTKFVSAAEELERKLATQFNLAFDDCATCLHAIKLYQMLGTIIERPVIFEEIQPRYKDIVDLFVDELDLIKRTFDTGIKNTNEKGLLYLPVPRDHPPTAGALRYIRALRGRMLCLSTEFPYLDKRIFENENGRLAMMQYEAMMGLLNDFQEKVFEDWIGRIEGQITNQMGQCILRREGHILKENFHNELVIALKETKSMKCMEIEGIPPNAFELSTIELKLRAARMKLFRIVEWYNYIIQRTELCELDLVREEINLFDKDLEPALTSVNWNNYEQTYVDDLFETIKQLFDRVTKTQENVQRVLDSIKSWGSKPMYARKEDLTDTLLNTNRDLVFKRLYLCAETKKLIDTSLNDENFRLFFNLTPNSCPCSEDEDEEDAECEEEEEDDDKLMKTKTEQNYMKIKYRKSFMASKINKTDEQMKLFRPYEEYVDKRIGEEIMNCINTSIRYIFFEIENRLEHNAPIFEIKLELQPPRMAFFPSINEQDRGNLISIVQNLIMDIYMMSDIVPRIAQPPEEERLGEDGVVHSVTYASFLNNEVDIEKMRNKIMKCCEETCDDIGKWVKRYKAYEYIWTQDRQKHLKYFVTHGVLALKTSIPEEEEVGGGTSVPKKKSTGPSLDTFRDTIDQFQALRDEVATFKDHIDFRVFLRVNCKGFKYTLMWEILEWSNVFKNYLKNQVIDSLQELEEFVTNAIKILLLEIDKDDHKGLLSIMDILNKIEERQTETDQMFEPLKNIVQLLKGYHINFDKGVQNQFTELPEKWNGVKKMNLLVRQRIAPMQAYQSDLIAKRVMLFEVRIKLFRKKFRDAPFFKYPCPKLYDTIDRANRDMTVFEEELKSLQQSTELFELNAPDAELLFKCRLEIKLIKQLWDFVYIIESSVNDWKNTRWTKIDVESIDAECKKFGKELRMLDKEMRSWDPYIETEAGMKNLMTSLRAVTELQNPALRDHHWNELMVTTNVRVEMNQSTTLANLLDLNLHKFEEDVKNIVDKSVKEMAMEKTLKDLNTTWSAMEFDYEKHARTGLKVLRMSEELIETLEDHQSQLQNMLASKFVAYFLREVLEWQTLLSNADAVIAAWFEVQRKWMYLESIFIGSEDIRKQLPEDSERFEQIDKEFKVILVAMGEEPNVVKSTNVPGLVDTLEHLQSQLVLCEKALNDYLETKRLAFPRFYFVSSADLLDILSNGNQPEMVARHLTKLYDSMAKLYFTKDSKMAHSMQAKEFETVPFKNPCDCSGQVEIWLNRVTDSMRSTLQDKFKQSLLAYEDKPRHKWVFDWPAQPALVVTQMVWSSETTVAFGFLEEGYENAMKDYQRKQINLLNSLITLLLDDLTPGDRQKIMTICTIDVHSRDVVAKLILQKVENSSAFQWQSQLRHRWDKKWDSCFINICDAQFRYDFEYLGNTPRLVITPLTDRCYITLTQSLHLIMGGAPAGPAGTGKTETTKDLGKGIGIMVYVFNCSEQMDYKSCGNIYKGLAQSGAWGCFDEFNRISVEVLSVVAVQVKTILDAIKAKKSKFWFLGEVIALTPTVGMFITMNPGYAGRAELPENLKALFRPCAMVVPDFALISEIMLVAEGFQEARLLSQKFITLYTLCKELLSKQDHYDWGLRAIKSVLVVAGALKRGDRDRPEDQVLMRALRDFNIPKIVTEDVPVFMGLIGDLFPNLNVPRKRDLEFEKSIKKSAIDLLLQPEDGFVLKIVQLEELFAVRHSVFVVGFAGTGKSEVWKTLYRTYYNQKRKPHYNDLNPKAVTNDELFGIINPSTREWKDGLFSVIMRDQANMGGTGPKWIVLDGDIDPMWIESLNTLMDDNKILTLASNERIALTKEMRLLFEIASLKTATPATVSRAGILYINPQDLGWNPYVASWISKRDLQHEKPILTLLFDKYVPPLLDIMKQKLKKITPISDIAMLQMTCHLLDCFLVPANVPSDCPKDWYEIYFVFAVIWGFGSALFQDQIIDWRNEFHKWWLSSFKSVRFPSAGTVFNYYIDPESKAFLPWTNLVGTFDLDPDIPLQSILVPTAETTRLRYFMDILIAAKQPVMLVGGAGSGKSVIVAEKLKNLSLRYSVTNVPFNFYTTSQMLQEILEKPLEKKAGRNFGPPGNNIMIYFIDDMNMPEVDAYGTVQPHTLIRQFMDYKHWYDRSKLMLKDIHNCQFVSCMNPTAGSFTINPRLQRHFCTFAVNFPGAEAMNHIYNSILSQHIANPANRFGPKIQDACEMVVSTAIVFHQRINQAFLPTATKFHYNFNVRDLANIFSGMMFATGDCVMDKNMLIRLWVHEATRVYGDKLVDFTDLEGFQKMLVETVRKNVEDFAEEIVFPKTNILFHFAENLNDAKYMPVRDWSSLNAILEEAQTGYNELVGALNLVLFEDAMLHICRVVRILSNDRGYAMLIGVGGSGKQSLSRLSAFICGLDVFQTQLRKGFTIIDLRTDLAALYMKTGVKNTSCCYLMTDSQVADEKFLVLINDLLASGEIPDLFAPDEIENIINAVRNEVKQLGIIDTRENCWQYYIDKVRRMLKVILCFSPVGSTLRVRGRKFPALFNCTAIDWFHEWPKTALESVSKRFLSEINVLPADLVPPVSQFMAYVHSTVNDMSAVYLRNEKRYNYTTPKSFLELIALYSKLLQEKNKECTDRIQKLENGLLKLADCANQVDGLKIQLKEQEVVLTVKREEANKQFAIVSGENEKVQKERSIAAEKEKMVRVIEEDVSAKAKICAEDLKKAEPVMLAAVAALDTLDRNSLTELKSFGSPPPAVIKVISAVIVLFAKNGKIPKDRSWKVGKAMMGNVDKFLESLKNYDKKHIHPEVIKALQPYLQDPEFDPNKVTSKSAAAAGICEWVININKFYDVYLIVGPKERALASAESELKNAQQMLEELNVRLNTLQEMVDALQAKLDEATNEKAKCQAEADKTEFTINLAYRLVDGLASENIRWRESVKTLHDKIITLPGNILLIACFISYVGCFSRRYRLDLQNSFWIPTFQKMEPAIPIAETSDPLELVCDDAQIAAWNNEGLPMDRMSSENAAILTNSSRWPLMIDPQLQGIKWIKKKYGTSLVVIRLAMKNYMDMIEKAVSNGTVMLMENIDEEIDAVLDPLMGRALIKKGKVLKLGDREIDYDPRFRLIIQTKLANPHYKPEMQAQATLINFTVTRDGLEDQLLAEVVKAERPDLEELKANLTTQQNTFKITLKMLEDDLLFRLSNAGENVLEDPTLVLNLEKTKKTAAEIEVKVVEAKITSKQIDTARELYRPAAERASILYFILNDLNKINKIYQYSLKAFTVVFNKAIEITPEGDSLALRVANLIDTISFSVFMYTSRALFEKDKLTFMAQMAIQILLQAKQINPVELDFLLRFPYTPNLLSPYDFLSHVGWGGIKSLSNLETFRNLEKDLEGYQKRWRQFTDVENPEREPLPGEWKNKAPLQRLCIIRCFRPDRMTYAMKAFVEIELGPKYTEARMISFPETFKESSNTTHVFFTLSPGVDPLKDVEQLGAKMKFSTAYDNFHNVSLGQGQEIVAENAMELASRNGHWVILQNIHLVAKWLPVLEKKIEATMEKSHENYRLFVSAEPAAAAEYHILPQGVLESAIKITNEPPSGMQANIHKCLDNFNQETLEMCSKEVEFKAILFALCYFHAVVAERRKFGPQGWNRSYPFNFGDLTISVYVLYNYLDANNRVPWEDLRYLFGEIMYGGHITDDWDRRLCRTYLEEYMQKELIDGDLFLASGFLAPPNIDYKGYHEYVDQELPPESPYLYGLHPNAEIGVLTTVSEKMFQTIFELQPRDSGGGSSSAQPREEIVKMMVEDIVDKIPDEFNMMELTNRIEDRTPYIIVALQESDRMNILMREIKRSLNELYAGLKGELTITPDMELLDTCLFFDVVPERWTKLAYPSMLGLQAWFADALLRLRELESWVADFKLPSAVWLAGFFNPQSFLTSIMQQTARKNSWPLDRMCLNCDVTRKQKTDFTEPPREGAYVYGLYMEGARWDMNTGSIADSKMKELFPTMPVVYIKAVTLDKQDTKNVYECPLYKIRMRGPTYVWTFNLKTKEKPAKWTLAGVCLLLQV